MQQRSETLQDDYWDQSVQPLNCLAFVAPLLFLYEFGIVWLGPSAMRNGADVWLREFLHGLGLGSCFLLPLATCGVLMGWHHVTRRDWTLRGEVLSGMICESFLLGICVLILAKGYGHVMGTPFSVDSSGAALRFGARFPHMLSYLGAGIYEELLFRLLLLSGMIALCRQVGAGHAAATALAIMSTSLLFAAAHYELFFHVGLDFTWYSFAFRLVAGALFSGLYLRRGFGIVVGTHVVYDILVATIA